MRGICYEEIMVNKELPIPVKTYIAKLNRSHAIQLGPYCLNSYWE